MLTLDPAFYNSGDPELKDFYGPQLVLNTIKCDGFKFSYLLNIKALKISDNTNVSITNFPNVINGASTSGDYLSILTMNY